MVRHPRAGATALVLAMALVAACGQKAGVHVAGAGGGGSLAGAAGTDSGVAAGDGSTAGAAADSTAGAAGGTAAGAATAGGSGSAAGGAPAGGAAAGGGTAAAAGPGDRTGVTDTNINVGIHAPVSGAAPFPSTSFSQGYPVYFKFISDKGGVNGRKIKPYFEDDGYNTSQAVSVCKKMVQEDKVFLLIGGGGADQIVACARYAASVGVPYVAEGTTDGALAKLTTDFSESMTYSQQAKLLASYIKNVVGKTKVSMVRADTTNFEDAHSAFVSAAQQAGLTMVKDITVPKDASATDAQTAAGQLCTHTNDADVVFPLMAPTIWINLAAAVHGQGCAPRWAGVGITMGLNIVATAVCGSGSVATGQASFFSPFPGLDKADAVDPDYTKAYKAQNPNSTPDDIGFALWGAEKLVTAQLAAAGRDLSRQSFVSSVSGKEFVTGVYPTVNYKTSHFGGTAVHVLKLDCASQQYVTEFLNKSSF